MAFNSGNVLESSRSGGLADTANARRVQLRGIDPTCWTHSAREQHGELSASGPDVGNGLAGAQLERLGEPGGIRSELVPLGWHRGERGQQNRAGGALPLPTDRGAEI